MTDAPADQSTEPSRATRPLARADRHSADQYDVMPVVASSRPPTSAVGRARVTRPLPATPTKKTPPSGYQQLPKDPRALDRPAASDSDSPISAPASVVTQEGSSDPVTSPTQVFVDEVFSPADSGRQRAEARVDEDESMRGIYGKVELRAPSDGADEASPSGSEYGHLNRTAEFGFDDDRGDESQDTGEGQRLAPVVTADGSLHESSPSQYAKAPPPGQFDVRFDGVDTYAQVPTQRGYGSVPRGKDWDEQDDGGEGRGSGSSEGTGEGEGA